jgi:hypothetical protein
MFFSLVSTEPGFRRPSDTRAYGNLLRQVNTGMAILLHTLLPSQHPQLRDIWLQEVRSGKAKRNLLDPKNGLIEVTQWLNKLTLDVIGLAGM